MYSVTYDVDIDECVSGNDDCSNANCVNNDGGFVCECLNGYAHRNSSSLQSACGKYYFTTIIVCT
ncbi:MAG: calcium-binding EGF-like domain-containing protein [Methylococcales symbiont of Iophon sp. n. MRB-2018]|nr:MAG: calcium-binding EGF-like domain-containing protein [Methylococcales symbiont of Iophon sp. n. MRB-2018]